MIYINTWGNIHSGSDSFQNGSDNTSVGYIKSISAVYKYYLSTAFAACE